MRIVAGKYKAKQLFVPKGIDVRPTLERTREALFSILYSKNLNFEELSVLDIFAGTGAFGFEALSRGAKNITFIDKDTKPVSKNASLFASEKDKIKIIKADVHNLPISTIKYNLIFMDAPYSKGLTDIAIENLINKDYIADNSLILVETLKSEEIILPPDLELCDERIYGIAKIRFFIFKKS